MGQGGYTTPTEYSRIIQLYIWCTIWVGQGGFRDIFQFREKIRLQSRHASIVQWRELALFQFQKIGDFGNFQKITRTCEHCKFQICRNLPTVIHKKIVKKKIQNKKFWIFFSSTYLESVAYFSNHSLLYSRVDTSKILKHPSTVLLLFKVSEWPSKLPLMSVKSLSCQGLRGSCKFCEYLCRNEKFGRPTLGVENLVSVFL